VLPSRNTTEVNDFNSVFKPYAPDPPRNLPPVIRAGVKVPPVPAYSTDQNVSAKNGRGTGAEASASLKHETDNGEAGMNTRALGIAIGATVLGVVFCVAVKLLHGLRSKLPGQGLAPWLKQTASQESMHKKMASFGHSTEDGTVRSSLQGISRLCELECDLVLDVLLASSRPNHSITVPLKWFILVVQLEQKNARAYSLSTCQCLGEGDSICECTPKQIICRWTHRSLTGITRPHWRSLQPV
jgi:hypothetical protein